jgi:hypothetical protein
MFDEINRKNHYQPANAFSLPRGVGSAIGIHNKIRCVKNNNLHPDRVGIAPIRSNVLPDSSSVQGHEGTGLDPEELINIYRGTIGWKVGG